MKESIALNDSLIPDGYTEWRENIEKLIESSKLQAVFHINKELLLLYWQIGRNILKQQEKYGWGAQVIARLSADLSKRFPGDRGYSLSNLKSMRRFAEAYPDFPVLKFRVDDLQGLPIGQVWLDQLGVEGEIGQVPLDQISWYHHISLLAKVKSEAERAFYIVETASNGWSRDVMLLQVANGYIRAKGRSINNFKRTLPPPQSDLAKYVFKDPYNFSFIGTMALQSELEVEHSLASRVTDFLLEMGRGFAFVGRQYHITVDGDDYYIDILMYHLRLHCYVVVELKAVEFIPEFVSKLNFYISAVDDCLKTPDDKPTIGLLLCRTKSDKKAEFALRGVTQPMGIAGYETQKLFAEVAEALPRELNAEMEDGKLEEEQP